MLWTKQDLGDSPPFPALVIRQPPFSPTLLNYGLGLRGLAGSGEVAPAAEPGCHGNEGFLSHSWGVGGGGLSCGGPTGSLSVLPPKPLLLRLREFRSCPDVGAEG